MKSINPILAGLLFIAASPAFAQGNKPMATVPVKDAAAADSISVPSAFSYTFVELGYGQTKFDDADIKADGFGVSGSYLLPTTLLPSMGSALYATAGYAMAETDKVDGETLEITDLRLGLGYRIAISSAMDLKAELDFLKQDLEVEGDSVDDSGFRIGLGARFQVTPQIEIGGGLRYTDILLAEATDSEIVLEGNGLYHIMNGFSALLNIALSSETTGFGIGGRYNFAF